MTDYTVSFSMILHAGNAKTASCEALEKARENKYEQAMQLVEEAEKEINEAHQSHADVLVQYANGEAIEVDLMFVHAQDHLMAATTINLLVKEMIMMYRKIGKGDQNENIIVL